MSVALESPNQPQVLALIADLDAYQDTLYPAESRYALDLASPMQPHVLFAVARSTSGEAVGCGAIVVGTRYGELKRMYVCPTSRGSGVAEQLLLLLERHAQTKGCSVVMLETGPYQPEALRFYRKKGYVTRGPFGGYKDDPLSVFMEKQLDASLR